MKPVPRQALAFRRNPPTGPESAAVEIPSRHNRAHARRTVRTIRCLLLCQVVGFTALAAIHFGLSVGGYRRPPAGATELVIVAALLVALLLTWGRPGRGQRVATAAQLLAALGALVALITTTFGIEPGTILEAAVNIVTLLASTAGLLLTRTVKRSLQWMDAP